MEESKVFKAKNGSEVIIRSAEKSDLWGLLGTISMVYRETPFLSREPEEMGIFTPESEEIRIASYRASDGAFMLVADVDGEAVGFCTVDPVIELYRNAHRCVVGIVIRRAYCGIGIGSQLLTAAMQRAAAYGYESMELEVSAKNLGAIRLYKKCGFEIYGLRPKSMRYKDGTYADDLLMIAQLQ